MPKIDCVYILYLTRYYNDNLLGFQCHSSVQFIFTRQKNNEFINKIMKIN